MGTRDSPTKERDPEGNKREPSTLRKRTLSAPHSSPASPTASKGFTTNGASGKIKQGQNILQQIGEPDHSGWMKKKGDRYNTWKLRYFVLKGPHLYFLRSNNKGVCFFLFFLYAY